MRKLNFYLETSVWNFYFADDAPEKRDLTVAFFKHAQAEQLNLFVSEIVRAEVERASEIKRRKLIDLINSFHPFELGMNAEVEELFDAYLKAAFVSSKARLDLLHLAYASANNLDVLLSWNLTHIVKLKTKLAVNGVNKQLGYHDIEIITPEEAL